MPTGTPKSTTRICKETFWYQTADGQPKLIKAGMTVREGHPIIKEKPEFFHRPDYVDLDIGE